MGQPLAKVGGWEASNKFVPFRLLERGEGAQSHIFNYYVNFNKIFLEISIFDTSLAKPLQNKKRLRHSSTEKKIEKDVQGASWGRLETIEGALVSGPLHPF